MYVCEEEELWSTERMYLCSGFPRHVSITICHYVQDSKYQQATNTALSTHIPQCKWERCLPETVRDVKPHVGEVSVKKSQSEAPIY